MKEIKFRAWDKKVKQWKGLWIFRGGHDGQKTHYPKPDVLNLTEYFCNPKYVADKEVVLMQFTGLSDKNGIEIYEGDILKMRVAGQRGYWHHIKNAVIDFHGGAFWFTGGGWTDCNWHFHNAIDREIIGNIWENPELLNSEQNVQASVARDDDSSTDAGDKKVVVHEIITDSKDYDRILEEKNVEIAELRKEVERLKEKIMILESSLKHAQNDSPF